MYQRTIALFVLLAGAVFAMHTQPVYASCDTASLGPVVYGQSGAAVTALQQCLLDAGYDIPAGVTGYYGEQTRVAVARFYAQELTMPQWDGRSAGPQGRSVLARHAGMGTEQSTPTPTVSASGCDTALLGQAVYGTQNEGVRALQRCLIRAGFSLPAGTTGYYGPQTRAAVQAFYRQYMSMSDWHGNSVGPLGRSVLAGRVTQPVPQGTAAGLKRVSDAAELQKYLSEPVQYGGTQFFGTTPMRAEEAAIQAPAAAQATPNDAAAERVSNTNVQVAGIDEPDMVKADSSHLYVSTGQHWYGWIKPMPLVTPAVSGVAVDAVTSMPVRYQPEPTKIVGAVPPTELAVLSDAIKETGEMLLVRSTHTLVVFSQPDIVAYDVTDTATPKELWRKTLDSNTSITAARLLNDTVYLVTQTWIPQDRPCPLPLISGVQRVDLACTDIMVPARIEPVSHTYTLMAIDSANGSVTKKLSVAGESGETVVSMSTNNLYLATPVYSAQYETLASLMIDVMVPYVSGDTITRARTILTYDISEAGKLQEIDLLLKTALATLNADERLRVENEAANKYQDLLREHVRDMYKSRITRIPLDTFTIAASVEIPGRLLNQFALDEYNGYVRTAVTIDDGWGGAESMNDVYVLDVASLNVQGLIKDLGLSERIYSVRFLGDVGYLVTFRQTDPFYVLDLRTPTVPKVVGELKIPGYSAYLEPLGNDLVLGVGREGSGVKLSVFDVANPSQPVEKAKYQLADSWTEVESNHHAFLRDPDYDIFFIPGGEGGYIFSYAGGSLSLEKALSGYSVKRAVYIGDYLYVVSSDKVRVLDENTWEEVSSISI